MTQENTKQKRLNHSVFLVEFDYYSRDTKIEFTSRLDKGWVIISAVPVGKGVAYVLRDDSLEDLNN